MSPSSNTLRPHLTTRRTLDNQRRVSLPPYVVEYDDGNEMSQVLITQIFEGLLLVVDENLYCKKCSTFKFEYDTEQKTFVRTACRCYTEYQPINMVSAYPEATE